MNTINASTLTRIVATLLAVWLLPVTSHGKENTTCRKVSLQSPPYWTMSGAWRTEGKSILLLDVLNEVITEYSILEGEGHRIDNHSQYGKVRLNHSRPTSLMPRDDGFILQLLDGEILILDEELKTRYYSNVYVRNDNTNESHGKASTTPRIASIFGISTVGERHLLTFSDLSINTGRGNEWTSGFFTTPLGRPEAFELIADVSIQDPYRGYYLNGNNYFASLGPRAFALKFQQKPELLSVTMAGDKPVVTTHPISKFLPDYRSAPPASWQDKPLLDRLDAIARMDIISGLFSNGDSLFILSREPGRLSSKGLPKTKWYVTKLAGDLSGSIGTVELPTSAQHIVVIPGKESWAILEKGKVIELGVQEMGPVLIIPAQWLDKPKSSPLLNSIRCEE